MALDRRDFLSVCGRFGLASTLFPGVLYTLATQAEAQTTTAAKTPKFAKITPEMIRQAAQLAAVPIPESDIPMMISGLNGHREAIETIRKLDLPNSMPPAFVFDYAPRVQHCNPISMP